MPTYLHAPINPLTRKSGRTKSRRIYQLHGSRSNRKRKLSDPFDGQYQCDPFADITQSATKQEVEDDITAICARITAVHARQPIPIYVVGSGWAERAEKGNVERKTKKEEKPKANAAVATSTDTEKGPITRARARAGKKEETPIQTGSSTIAEKVDADGPRSKNSQKPMVDAEAPILEPSKPKTASRRAPQSFNDTHDADQPENEEPETTPTSGSHKAPKRQAHTPPAPKPATTADGNEEIWEPVCLTQPNSEIAKKLKLDKSTFELNAKNEKRLVQKRLSGYFGSRGREGAQRSSLEVTSFLGY